MTFFTGNTFRIGFTLSKYPHFKRTCVIVDLTFFGWLYELQVESVCELIDCVAVYYYNSTLLFPKLYRKRCK